MMQADIHFHLLPGVDDGPADLEASLDLARAAVGDGTAMVVATPHAADVVIGELPERVAEVRAALRDRAIPLAVQCAAELNVADVAGIDGDELELIAAGPAGRRWILLEPLFTGLGAIAEASGHLRSRGYGIVLAHPERCGALWDGALREELAAGAVAQVSGGSLLGVHGTAAQRRAWALVTAPGAAVVIASDAHCAEGRPPMLSAARAALEDRGVGGLAKRLVDSGPASLIRDGLRSRQGAAIDG